MHDERLPTARAIVDSIGALTSWYAKFKPTVRAIAVEPLQMLRIERMIENRDAQGFTRNGDEIYFRGFRVYVAHVRDVRAEHAR